MNIKKITMGDTSFFTFYLDLDSVKDKDKSFFPINTEEKLYKPFRFFQPKVEKKERFMFKYEKKIGERPTIVSKVHIGSVKVNYENIFDKWFKK